MVEDMVTVKAYIENKNGGQSRDDYDVRRLRVKEPPDFAGLMHILNEKLLMMKHLKFVMKYKDSEGDFCTLASSTFSDFLALGQDDKVFRLHLFRKKEVSDSDSIIKTEATNTQEKPPIYGVVKGLNLRIAQNL